MNDTHPITHSLQTFDAHLDSIFESFYGKLMSDRHFSVFFRDDTQIRNLVVRQRENLRASLQENEAQLKARYGALGRFHHRIFVPYPDFLVGVDFLSDQFYAVLTKTPNIRCSADEVFRFFDLVKNYTAKGYLDGILEEDNANLEVFIAHMQETRESLSGLLERRMSWLKQVLQAIEKEDERCLPSLEVENSEFFDWIVSDEAKRYVARDEDRAQLLSIHQRIVTDVRNLFYFIKTEHYTEVLVMYIKISRLMLTLTHLATILIADYKMRQMVHDELTGLANRQTMENTVKQKLKLALLVRRPVSLILTDIDSFKQINDRHGHVAGDCILRGTAEILRRYIRTSDDAFRFGGEEFLLLLDDTDIDGARVVAEKIRETVSDTVFHCQERQLRITLSLGIASTAIGRHYSPMDLINTADERLYQAKRNGKNQVCW